MSQVVSFLIWLLCVGISAILIGYFIKESFNPVAYEGFAVHTCPAGTNSFVTDSGETQCCNGDVVDGYCTGNLRCTLSPKSKSGLPTCTDLAAADAAASGANQCPVTMPNYFVSTSVKGCSVSQATSDGTAPLNPNLPQCILYPTQELDLVKLDSCYNVVQNATKAAQCSAAQATANLPACVAAAAAVSAPPPAAGSACLPPITNFVIYGDSVDGRVRVEKRSFLSNGNIVYAIQQSGYVKMVITDKNNIPLTSRYYSGPISELSTRASDMTKINAMSDATGHYILATAP